jgi:glycine cleavage system H protein
MINEDPYGDGWFVKIEMIDPSDLDDLLDGETYEQHVREQEE